MSFLKCPIQIRCFLGLFFFLLLLFWGGFGWDFFGFYYLFPNFLLYLNVSHPPPPILWKRPTAAYTFPHLHTKYGATLLECPHP